METALYINNKLIDLTDNVSITTTSSVADIREPHKRQGDFTKTIVIPGTKANNKILSHIFDIGYASTNTSSTNFNPDFNPNLKATALLTRDEIPQLKGHARLLRINVIDEDEIYYEIGITGKIISFYTDVGSESKLEDLDLSSNDHTYSYTNIVNSWGAAVGSGYVYPMIDYGSTDLQAWKIEDFLPAVYVKEYIDKIFSAAGWTFTSTFLESTIFKSLIIPFNSDQAKLTEAQILNRTFYAQKATGTWDSEGGNAELEYDNLSLTEIELSFEDESTGDFNDAGGVWDETEMTVASKGFYSFEVEADVRLAHDTTGFLLCDVLAQIEIVKRNFTGEKEVISSSAWQRLAIGSSTQITAGDKETSKQFSLKTGNLFIEEGDYITVRCPVWAHPGKRLGDTYYGDRYNPSHAEIVGFPKLEQNGTAGQNTFRSRIFEAQLQEGETMLINNIIPKNIKQKSFLTWLIQMFNLYVDLDKTVDNRLLIEPRDDFYNTNIIELDDYIDLSKPVEETPMGELDFKTFVYKYSSDKDYYNQKYEQRYGDVYGTETIEVQNDFVTNTRKQEVGFASTPIAGTTLNDRSISTIYAKDENGLVTSITGKIRILYYGGLLSTVGWSLQASSGHTSQLTYPYAGHLDDPTDPNFDLNFGVPKEVYYRASKYTDNNLYNAYHKKGIDEITDKDSKIVSAWFYLHPALYYQIDYRKLYHFLGHNFRLNKIYDHDAATLEEKITKVEFIRVKEGTTFTKTQPLIDHGGPADGVPGPSQPHGPRGNVIPPHPWVGVKGQGNIIDPAVRDVNVLGDYNKVVGEAIGVNIVASSGVTVAASNVAVMASSGVTVVDDNTLLIHGKNVGNNAVLVSETFYVSSGDIRSGLPLVLIEAKGDGQVVDVISAVSRHIPGVGEHIWSGSLPNLNLQYGSGWGDEIGRWDLQWGTLGYMKMTHVDDGQMNANADIELDTGGNYTSGSGYYIIEILYRVIEI